MEELSPFLSSRGWGTYRWASHQHQPAQVPMAASVLNQVQQGSSSDMISPPPKKMMNHHSSQFCIIEKQVFSLVRTPACCGMAGIGTDGKNGNFPGAFSPNSHPSTKSRFLLCLTSPSPWAHNLHLLLQAFPLLLHL